MSSVLFRKWGIGFGFMTKAMIIRQRGFFQISKEILEAVENKQPVVALETTIYTHGRQRKAKSVYLVDFCLTVFQDFHILTTLH